MSAFVEGALRTKLLFESGTDFSYQSKGTVSQTLAQTVSANTGGDVTPANTKGKMVMQLSNYARGN